MKLSIWSSYYYELSPEEAVERFCENGIYCSELSDEHGLQLLTRDEDYIKTATEFASFLKSRNFEMSQGHLWLKAKICSDESAVATLCRWIDLYEAIGVKNMVLHCDNLESTDLSKEEKTSLNVQKLRLLAKHIENKNITVCLENLRPHSPEDREIIDQSADDLLGIIGRIGSDRFGICLDTGHLNITLKDQRAFILTSGKKLKALHIANNEGVTDQHMMPFTRGNVNFVEVIKALREVGYDGVFNLEIPGESQIPLELRDAKLSFIKTCFNYLMT